MSSKPADYLRLTSELPAKADVLIAAFEGWNDAGDAATIAAKHLQGRWNGAQLGHIEPEEFYDFTATRPRVALDDRRKRQIQWPDISIWAGPIDDERNAIVVLGSEPQLRWRTFSQEIIDIARRCDVKRIITLGALLAEVPHTRPTPVFGSSENLELAEQHRLEPSTYEGPTGIVGVLNTECLLNGLDVVSLWAAVPSYLPGASSPKAARALIGRLAPILEAEINTADLDDATKNYEHQVGELVSEDEDTVEYVRQLEEHHDDEDNLESTDPEALVAELEQFLRNQQ